LIEQTSFLSSRNWLLGDHLGSTSMVTDASGVMVSEVRYSAFGETRYQNGTLTTDYLYTGQRQEMEIGLYYYVARWYDPAIGRFIQADSIVPNPGSAVGFDRYAYSWNNPLNFVDPSGHKPLCLDNQCFDTEDKNPTLTYTPTKQELEMWLDEELGIGEYFDVEKEIKRNVADIIPTGSGYQASINLCTTSVFILASPCIGLSFEAGFLWSSGQPYVSVSYSYGAEVGTPLLASVGGSAGMVFHHNVTNVEQLAGTDVNTGGNVGLSAVANVDLSAEISYSLDPSGDYAANKETGNRLWSSSYAAGYGMSVEPGISGHLSAGVSETNVMQLWQPLWNK